MLFKTSDMFAHIALHIMMDISFSTGLVNAPIFVFMWTVTIKA